VRVHHAGLSGVGTRDEKTEGGGDGESKAMHQYLHDLAPLPG
jgi:hypothetical protein